MTDNFLKAFYILTSCHALFLFSHLNTTHYWGTIAELWAACFLLIYQLKFDLQIGRVSQKHFPILSPNKLSLFFLWDMYNGKCSSSLPIAKKFPQSGCFIYIYFAKANSIFWYFFNFYLIAWAFKLVCLPTISYHA